MEPTPEQAGCKCFWGLFPVTASPMTHYRIYFTSRDGHIAAPATLIECDDDDEAIPQCAQKVGGGTAELWQGSRRVMLFPGDDAE